MEINQNKLLDFLELGVVLAFGGLSIISLLQSNYRDMFIAAAVSVFAFQSYKYRNMALNLMSLDKISPEIRKLL